MILVKTISDLQKIIRQEKAQNIATGLIPTMGALHAGHISLLHAARQNNNFCVCSIFVNPVQFNNKEDLAKYPRTLDKDISLLQAAGCEVLFCPEVEEMYYRNEVLPHYELGYIETVLEGRYRPGHFQGVCAIVDKLLQAAMPDVLYLGQKDYQQCMVIKKMMAIKDYKTRLQICETVREPDGLAMSSRNVRLNADERKQALQMIHVLKKTAEKLTSANLNEVKEQAVQYLQQNGFKVDYVEIADTVTLQPVENLRDHAVVVLLAAAFLNEVRLIDNIVVHQS